MLSDDVHVLGLHTLVPDTYCVAAPMTQVHFLKGKNVVFKVLEAKERNNKRLICIIC